MLGDDSLFPILENGVLKRQNVSKRSKIRFCKSKLKLQKRGSKRYTINITRQLNDYKFFKS